MEGESKNVFTYINAEKTNKSNFFTYFASSSGISKSLMNNTEGQAITHKAGTFLVAI